MGLAFSWVTFDEGYGGKPGFLRGLVEREPTVRGRSPRIADGLDRATVAHGVGPTAKGGRADRDKVPGWFRAARRR